VTEATGERVPVTVMVKVGGTVAVVVRVGDIVAVRVIVAV